MENIDGNTNNDKVITVDEMIEKLQLLSKQGLGDKPLSIPYDKGLPSVGALPSLSISNISVGFDWDDGKIFLLTKERLGIVDEELKEKLIKTSNQHGWLLYDIGKICDSKIFTPEQIVEQIKERVIDEVLKTNQDINNDLNKKLKFKR